MADIVGTTVASRRWPAGGKPMVGRRWPADGGPTSASNGNVPPASHRLTDGGPLVAICRRRGAIWEVPSHKSHQSGLYIYGFILLIPITSIACFTTEMSPEYELYSLERSTA